MTGAKVIPIRRDREVSRDDLLAPARGVTLGVVLGAAIWALLCGIAALAWL